jgi:hypothetical protein
MECRFSVFFDDYHCKKHSILYLMKVNRESVFQSDKVQLLLSIKYALKNNNQNTLTIPKGFQFD